MDDAARRRLLAVIADSDVLIAEDGDSDDPVAERCLADALWAKGRALDDLDRQVEAIAIWDEIIKRYAVDPPAGRVHAATKALARKAADLQQLGRDDEASEVAGTLLALCQAQDATTEVQRLAAWALAFRRRTLDPDRATEKIAIDDEIIRRFGHAEDDALRTHVAYALAHKASLLLTQDDVDAALAVGRDLKARVTAEPEETFPAVADVALDFAQELCQDAPPGVARLGQIIAFSLVTVVKDSLVRCVVELGGLSRTQPKVPGGRPLFTVLEHVENRFTPDGWIRRQHRFQAAVELSRAVLARARSSRNDELEPIAVAAEIVESIAQASLGHPMTAFRVILRVMNSGDPAAVQAFQKLAQRQQVSTSTSAQLAQLGLLGLRAFTLGNDDSEIARIAFDDSVNAHTPTPPSRTARLFRRMIRPR